MAVLATYYLSGVNFTTYGVYVSRSSGILDRGAVKDLVKHDWKEYNGEVVDLTNKYYQSREIVLDCFIKAATKADFVDKWVTFMQLFDSAGTRRLHVDISTTKPLLFEVYSAGELSLTKTWSAGAMSGTFKLVLTEPNPQKRILKHTGSVSTTCTITITSAKLIDIHWGDGTVTRDVSGTAKVSEHTYANANDYYVVLAGCIDEITALTTSATVVWSKL